MRFEKGRDLEPRGGASEICQEVVVKLDAGRGIKLIDDERNAGRGGEAGRLMEVPREAASERLILPGAAKANDSDGSTFQKVQTMNLLWIETGIFLDDCPI